MLQILEPQDAGGVAGHAPVATGTEAATGHLGAVGQTTALVLLGKEAAAEDAQPLADDGIVVLLAEGLASQEVYLGGTEPPA